MAKRLTKEEYKQRLFEAVGDKYSLYNDEFPYQNKTSLLKFHCNIHNIDFSASAECFMRGPNDIRSSCPICANELIQKQRQEKRTTVNCAYCGKQFDKLTSRLSASKSGLYFCCREHKDLAQRLESGEQFNTIRPDHFGKSINGATSNDGYRRAAFINYPHKCAVCGWDEDEDILQVHHIDEDRQNGKLTNLIILCPTCHWKLTMKKYKLIGRDKIIKIE